MQGSPNSRQAKRELLHDSLRRSHQDQQPSAPLPKSSVVTQPPRHLAPLLPPQPSRQLSPQSNVSVAKPAQLNKISAPSLLHSFRPTPPRNSVDAAPNRSALQSGRARPIVAGRMQGALVNLSTPSRPRRSHNATTVPPGQNSNRFDMDVAAPNSRSSNDVPVNHAVDRPLPPPPLFIDSGFAPYTVPETAETPTTSPGIAQPGFCGIDLTAVDVHNISPGSTQPSTPRILVNNVTGRRVIPEIDWENQPGINDALETLKDFLVEKRKHKGSSMTSSKETEDKMSKIANSYVPKTTAAGVVCLCVCSYDNSELKLIVKVLKIAGITHSRIVVKRKAIAVNLVQLELPLRTVMEVVYDLDIQTAAERIEGEVVGTERHNSIRSLSETSVSVDNKHRGADDFTLKWRGGDIPEFDANGEVVPGAHAQKRSEKPADTCRQEDFTANEYARLLHVLVDSRMTSALEILTRTFTKAQLDAETVDPWTVHLAPLFNNSDFNPEKETLLRGGVSQSDIQYINPVNLERVREGGFLKAKYGDFRKEYETAVSNYNKSGQHDPEAFPFVGGFSYLLYGYCLLQGYPLPMSERMEVQAPRK